MNYRSSSLCYFLFLPPLLFSFVLFIYSSLSISLSFLCMRFLFYFLLLAFSSLDKPRELKPHQEEDNGSNRSQVYLPAVVGTWIDRMKSRFIVWVERSRRVRTHGCHVVYSLDNRLLPPEERINDYLLSSYIINVHSGFDSLLTPQSLFARTIESIYIHHLNYLFTIRMIELGSNNCIKF